jgi:hypothetical protein
MGYTELFGLLGTITGLSEYSIRESTGDRHHFPWSFVVGVADRPGLMDWGTMHRCIDVLI